MSTALLVIDMQNFFAAMTTTALPSILHLLNLFNSLSLPIIFTQHGHTTAELTPPLHNQLVRKWGPEGSIATGSKDWELQPPIADFVRRTQMPVFAKNTYDAFINTKLEDFLRGEKTERVIVCGVMTDCCCDTTARSAFNRGFETWLVSDACGSATKKQHEAGLRGYGYAFGEVLGTEEVTKRITEIADKEDDQNTERT